MTRTQRPPVRPRSGRRPIPPLIFLLVLALAAGGVWWNVLRQDDQKQAAEDEACPTAEAASSLDPASVSLRVFNATDEAGLAQKVADEMQVRGFVVDEIANDPTDRQVTGPGEVRHGPRGTDAAAFVALHLPGAADYLDTRATGVVDLVLGPEFVFPDSLAAPEAVAAALSTAPTASAC